MIKTKNKVSKRQKQKRLPAHSMSIEQTCDAVSSDLKIGITEFEADRRLARYGHNEIPLVKSSIWKIYLAPLFNWLINIYLILSLLLMFLGIWIPSSLSQSWMWIGNIIITFFFAIFQQIRAKFKLDALERLSAPTTTVIRDAMIQEIKATEVVPGDLLQLSQGDRVPADARILQAYNCLVNESSLTGESGAVAKTDNPTIVLQNDTPISERKNMLYLGTYIESGKVLALCTNTGAYTELGTLSQELQEIGVNDIPIRAKINELAKGLGAIILLFLISNIAFKTVIHIRTGSSLENYLEEIVNAITTGMSMMPIMIPILTAIILLTGALSMAKDNVIIRNLSSIETLGRCSILCTDKTGTITTNQMTIQRVWDTNALYGVSGKGYSNEGIIYPLDDAVEPPLEPNGMHVPDSIKIFLPGTSLEHLLIGGMLNNDAQLIVEEVYVDSRPEQVTWRTTGDPTDGAFLALFNKSGLEEKELKIKEKFEIVYDYPFDSSIKRMSRLFKSQNKYYLFTKGATETVLNLCSYVGGPDNIEKLSQEKKAQILTYANKFASVGYRVISLAYRIDQEITSKNRDDIENNLVYNGFVCMLDPPRPGVKDSVNLCQRAKVNTIMITGDSRLTAESIGRKVGIIGKNEKAVEGKDIKNLSEEQFFNTRIFARVSPQHKQFIIEKYEEKDRMTAMTGDGVNDALALAKADVGIAMGMEGTDVAKQASDIIIADDSFVSTVLGIREGRGLFERIRLMVLFFISINIAEALVYFISSFIVDFTLINNIQRAVLIISVHDIPPLAIIFNKTAKDIMDYPSRDNESIFTKQYIGVLIIMVLSMALSAGFVFLFAYSGIIPLKTTNYSGIIPTFSDQSNSFLDPHHMYHAKARTMYLAVVLFSESFIVLSIRRMNMSLFQQFKEDFSLFALFCVTLVPVLFVILMYITQIQLIFESIGANFELIALNLGDWLIVIFATSLSLIFVEIFKKLVRKNNKYF